VTTRAYDIVERYRDLGGNLLFLAANNFFRRVRRDGRHLVREQLWRDVGRDEAGLVGVRYVGSDQGQRQAPRRRGSSRARGSVTATRSAGTGSRSTVAAPPRRAGRACSRVPPT
jgi:hypothetical protein